MFRKLIILIGLFVSIAAYSQEIDLLILTHDYPKALEQIDVQLKINPSATLYFKKGLVYEKLMNYEKAIVAFHNACRIEGSNVVFLEELAEANSSLGNYTDAIVYLQKAVDLDPDNLPLKGKLAQTYMNLKAYDDAYNYYKQIYEQDSVNAYINRYFAYSAYKTERLKMAAKLYEELAKNGSRDINVYLNLATIYNKQENQLEAIEACIHGIKVFPNHPALLLKNADTYFLHKDYAKAQFPYEQYLAVSDSAYDVLKNYGICLYFNKDEERALEMLGKCYKMVVNDPILNFYIGASYKKLKQLPESVAFFELAIETATPAYLAEIYHHMGQVYGWQREFEQSIKAYKIALELDPTKVELLYEIASTVEEYQLNSVQALTYYQSYLKEAGTEASHSEYALARILKIKEELFMNE